MTNSGWNIPLHVDFLGMLPCFGHVVSKLHSQEMAHVGTESLLDAQGHLGGERALALEKVREGSAADFQDLGCPRHGETEDLNDLGPDQVARVWWILYRLEELSAAAETRADRWRAEGRPGWPSTTALPVQGLRASAQASAARVSGGASGRQRHTAEG